MKKKVFSKILSILLAGAMVIGAAGCGKTETKESVSAQESKESVEKQESKTEADAAQSTEAAIEEKELTYPLDTDQTLTVWSDRLKPAAAYLDYKESPFHIGLSENTGVDIEWQYPVEGADANQSFNLLLTEDVLPDIIMKLTNISDAEVYIEDGIIYDLTEYLPKYAPDYWAYLNDTGRIKEVLTSNGQIPGISMYVEGDFNNTYQGPVIRQDWLDECGLKAPVTVEDMENVLVTFKEKYDAKAAIGPYLFKNFGFASGFGAYTTYAPQWHINDEGKVQFSMGTPEWKEYISTLVKWCEMDLIDKDLLTGNTGGKDLRTKVLEGDVGYTLVAMSALTTYIEDAEAENTGAEFVGAPYLRTAPDEPTCWINTVNGYRNKMMAMITTSCPEERLITALQFLNYGFTEEGIMYWNYGNEGESYIIDSQGEVQWTELVTADKDGLNEAIKKYAGMYGNGISVQLSRMVQLKNNPACTDAVYTWIDNSDANTHCLPSAMSFNAEEQLEFTDLSSALTTYAEEMILKIILGEEPLENLDGILAQMDSMGAARITELYQAAYDRYLAR